MVLHLEANGGVQNIIEVQQVIDWTDKIDVVRLDGSEKTYEKELHDRISVYAEGGEITLKGDPDDE